MVNLNGVEVKMQISESKKQLLANRTTNNYLLTTNYCKYLSKDLVPEEWQNRHIKLIRKIGIDNYETLVQQAMKSSTPQRLLAWLVDQEMKSIQEKESHLAGNQ